MAKVFRSRHFWCPVIFVLASHAAQAEVDPKQWLESLIGSIQEKPAQPKNQTMVAAPVPPPASEAVSSPAEAIEWSKFFKGWENGCDIDEAVSNFSVGLKQRKVVLPISYRPAAGHIKVKKEREFTTSIIELKGKYYGLPVKSYGYAGGNENGIRSYWLTLGVPLKTAKQKLKGVRYKTQMHDMLGSVGVELNEDSPSSTSLVCDLST